MDVKFDYQLRGDQRANPAVYVRQLSADEMEGIPIPTDAELEQVFTTTGYKLQTWNRAKRDDGKLVKENDAHWLAVRGSTTLHTDPAYPRYSHQLKIRVDAGVIVRGLDLVETPLYRGTYYCLDTHSPHQVVSNPAGGWNVTASIDAKQPGFHRGMIQRLLSYARFTGILEGV